jgi:predicted DNA-binding protein (MmcQ/YjbR family)
VDRYQLREYCLSLPGATEEIQWGHDLLFKVSGKMFVASSIDGELSLSIKCTAEDFHELVEREDIIPAPYLARYHWVMLKNERAMKTSELKQRIKRSYDMVVAGLPKKVRQSLEV